MKEFLRPDRIGKCLTLHPNVHQDNSSVNTPNTTISEQVHPHAKEISFTRHIITMGN